MMYTEAEAKTKWCPLSRAIVWNDGETLLAAGANLKPNGEPASMCIASACMAWRVFSKKVAAVVEERELAQPSGPVGEGWTIKSSGVDEPEEGHAAYAWNIWSRETKPAQPELGFCGAFGPAKAGAA
jgi:hypothetical protein